MENEEILRQFEEIEQKVEKLIELCQSLKADNAQLINKINRLEHELQEKADVEKGHAEEKAFIRSKIDNLLVRLKDITEVS
ncbi:hypothetical protein [Desulfonema magnum]|uniref:Cell division protein ZapB n=1 Tax=Desulfonema magnum TaxID=45655 RepID=A0A975BXN0_9BACT|nr:hypothetical protein [Desulfonema magnum]QTA93198.1 Uncharacterized protein dnm_092980 [Desulfonema magnum]